ncbi:predicted protein [Nematostella vectensis]|uniref:ShKT domain-containing protein n=1 Tax=Nematostella vectensis TaxID=45351 RepID=A7SQK9_NEMVE|nr:predicted protein [Nematostella vectensis]|eukprot:XP_001626106.1 predicted protein [Nematostella vectensis]
MGMRINTKKTETMCIGNTADFYVDGIKLVNVTHFKYLGSILSSDCSMRAELTSRIQAVSCAYGRLRKRVFDSPLAEYFDAKPTAIHQPMTSEDDPCDSQSSSEHFIRIIYTRFNPDESDSDGQASTDIPLTTDVSASSSFDHTPLTPRYDSDVNAIESVESLGRSLPRFDTLYKGRMHDPMETSPSSKAIVKGDYQIFYRIFQAITLKGNLPPRHQSYLDRTLRLITLHMDQVHVVLTRNPVIVGILALVFTPAFLTLSPMWVPLLFVRSFCACVDGTFRHAFAHVWRILSHLLSLVSRARDFAIHSLWQVCSSFGRVKSLPTWVVRLVGTWYYERLAKIASCVFGEWRISSKNPVPFVAPRGSRKGSRDPLRVASLLFVWSREISPDLGGATCGNLVLRTIGKDSELRVRRMANKLKVSNRIQISVFSLPEIKGLAKHAITLKGNLPPRHQSYLNRTLRLITLHMDQVHVITHLEHAILRNIFLAIRLCRQLVAKISRAIRFTINTIATLLRITVNAVKFFIACLNPFFLLGVMRRAALWIFWSYFRAVYIFFDVFTSERISKRLPALAEYFDAKPTAIHQPMTSEDDPCDSQSSSEHFIRIIYTRFNPDESDSDGQASTDIPLTTDVSASSSFDHTPLTPRYDSDVNAIESVESLGRSLPRFDTLYKGRMHDPMETSPSSKAIVKVHKNKHPNLSISPPRSEPEMENASKPEVAKAPSSLKERAQYNTVPKLVRQLRVSKQQLQEWRNTPYLVTVSKEQRKAIESTMRESKDEQVAQTKAACEASEELKQSSQGSHDDPGVKEVADVFELQTFGHLTRKSSQPSIHPFAFVILKENNQRNVPRRQSRVLNRGNLFCGWTQTFVLATQLTGSRRSKKDLSASQEGSCRDQYRTCPGWGASGYCDKPFYKSFMKLMCAYTCDTCDVIEEPKPRKDESLTTSALGEDDKTTNQEGAPVLSSQSEQSTSGEKQNSQSQVQGESTNDNEENERNDNGSQSGEEATEQEKAKSGMAKWQDNHHIVGNKSVKRRTAETRGSFHYTPSPYFFRTLRFRCALVL